MNDQPQSNGQWGVKNFFFKERMEGIRRQKQGGNHRPEEKG